MSVKFVDEVPEVNAGPYVTKWSKIADELRANPGQWALIEESAYAATGTQLRKGRRSGWTPGEFEVRQRTVTGTGKVDLYARYVGDNA